MNYFFSRLFRKKNNFKQIDDIRLEFAFEVGGIRYFEPVDLHLFPWQRALSATEAFNKLQLGIYPEDLKFFQQTLDKCLTSQKFDIVSLINLKRLTEILGQRLDSQFRPTEMMWDAAAVIFMDETESPYLYDPVYGKKKIEFWKKHEDVVLFFSQLSVRRLLPFIPAIEENSKLFSETITELTKIEKDISSGSLSTGLQKQKENLQSYLSKKSAKTIGRR